MGALFKKLAGDSVRNLRKYTGDTAFLTAAAAIAANVTAADGEIEEKEIKKAKQVMTANEIIKTSFEPYAVEKAVAAALDNAETRSGKMANKRALEAMQGRDQRDREDLFLIGVDVADVGEIGDAEMKVLRESAELLGVDADKLLG